MIKKLFLLLHTLRFLKLIQFYRRFYLKLIKFIPFSTVIKQTVIVRKIELIPSIIKHSSCSDRQFIFLNEGVKVTLPVDWNNQHSSKLWLYNLHYFDYLNQAEIEQQFVVDLMIDWIENNLAGTGNGWEPYTLSLRIVNWFKFLDRVDIKGKQIKRFHESLYLQSRFLYTHLEYHLLGNHLFKNGVALMFAGVFFEGKEARKWLEKGKQIVLEQTKEQVLADGGHFERSPMYHVLILEDILDCINLNKIVSCFSLNEAEYILEKATAMVSFLMDILHPDGEIPFFNDSALKVAPSPQSIFNYANDLGIKFNKLDENSCIEKPDYGLIILQNQMCKMIFDVGKIGPDYIPGHAHCDSLSYEFSLSGVRCIVNSGTFQYAGGERNSFRSTSAHNTVEVDGVEQHEIWSTFRVARRGYPFDVTCSELPEDAIECSASLSGYMPSHPVHIRSIVFHKDYFIIKDTVDGKGEHVAKSFVHLHPDVEIIKHSVHSLQCRIGDVLFSIKALEGEVFDIKTYDFSPEFGLKIESTVLVLSKQAESPFSFGYQVGF